MDDDSVSVTKGASHNRNMTTQDAVSRSNDPKSNGCTSNNQGCFTVSNAHTQLSMLPFSSDLYKYTDLEKIWRPLHSF